MARGHIFRNHRARAHYGAVSDRNTLKDEGSRAHENTATDSDGPGNVRANIAVITPPPFAYGHMRIIVENHRPGAEDRPLPNFDEPASRQHRRAHADAGTHQDLSARR